MEPVLGRSFEIRKRHFQACSMTSIPIHPSSHRKSRHQLAFLLFSLWSPQHKNCGQWYLGCIVLCKSADPQSSFKCMACIRSSSRVRAGYLNCIRSYDLTWHEFAKRGSWTRCHQPWYFIFHFRQSGNIKFLLPLHFWNCNLEILFSDAVIETLFDLSDSIVQLARTDISDFLVITHFNIIYSRNTITGSSCIMNFLT